MSFDINDFLNKENHICREERQYAALLYAILLKAKNEELEKHKSGIIISLLGDAVETIEQVFFEATIMRDYFFVSDKKDFNNKLLKYCGVDYSCEIDDSLASSSYNWSDVDIKNIEQKARFLFARYMMRAKPDIMVIYTDKGHGRCAKILECKKESNEGKYKDIWGSETINQETVQACIMNFLFGRCNEEMYIGTYPEKAKAYKEYQVNKDAYDFQGKLVNYDNPNPYFEGIINMGVKETDFDLKKNSNAVYIPAKCLIEYAYEKQEPPTSYI